MLFFLIILFALLLPNACISTGELAPTPIPATHALQILQTHTPTPVIYPVYGDDILLSPDGTKKAVWDAYTGRTFYIIDANEIVMWSVTYDTKKFSDVFQLVEASYNPFYWSKDEKFLYYTCFHGQEIDSSGKFYGNEFIDGCGVFRLNVETGETTDILPEIAPGYGYYAFSISPDEKYLVYTYQNETPVQIKLLDLSTREERVLLTADENILETGRYGWSPQEDQLVFMTLKISEDEKRLYSIFILDLDIQETKLLVKDLDTRIRFVSWDKKGIISYRPDMQDFMWQLNTETEIFSVVTMTPP